MFKKAASKAAASENRGVPSWYVEALIDASLIDARMKLEAFSTSC
jgi:hypothetical protein